MVKHFDRCLCANLRTGTIIIGALGIVGSLYYIGVASVNVNPQPGKHGDPAAGGTATRVGLAIIGVVQLILNAVLVFGAVKNKPKLVRPWILVTAVLLCLGLIVTVAKGIFLLVGGDIGQGVGTLLTAIITALIQVYFILIVNSFHTTLINGDLVATQTA